MISDSENLARLEKFIYAELANSDPTRTVPGVSTLSTLSRILGLIRQMQKDNLIQWLHTNTNTNTNTNTSEKYATLTFGSAEDNIIVLPSLAKHHAQVRFYSNGSLAVTDLGTVHGTFVQDSILSAPTRVTQKMALFATDQLVFVNPANDAVQHIFSYSDMISRLLSFLGRDSLWGEQ